MRRLCLIFAILLLPCVASAATSDIQSLINSLGDPDPASRESAAEAIKRQGASARASLIAAMRSDNPEIAARAAIIVQQLPWYLPDDPPPVREILTNYGKGNDNARVEAIRRLWALRDLRGQDALCRLLREEPSDGIRWVVETMLRSTKAERFRARLRDLDTAGSADNAPLLATVGWAWHGRDVKKSTELFRRAIALQLSRPTEEYGEVRSVLIPVLVDEATHARKFNDAAELLREQIGPVWQPMPTYRRGRLLYPRAVENPESNPALHLMALHAEFGPLRGFAADVRNLRPSLLSDPRMLYCVGKFLRRAGCPLAAKACDWLACDLGQNQPESRLMSGVFFMQLGWPEPARLELQAALARGGDDHSARALLAKIAADAGDFETAAEHCKAIKPLVPPNAEEARWIAGELHWRLFQAARKKNDSAAMTKELDAIVNAMSTSGEIAMDAVPALKKLGRKADADRLFTAVYNAMRLPGNGGPGIDLEDPEQMNNLAWLCARCGEQLDLALKLSTQAITAEPENAAYLDTAAEANFRSGKYDEAVRLETRALQFRVADKFMSEQLERFKKGNGNE